MCQNTNSDSLDKRIMSNGLLIYYFLGISYDMKVLFLNWENKISLAILKNRAFFKEKYKFK